MQKFLKNARGTLERIDAGLHTVLFGFGLFVSLPVIAFTLASKLSLPTGRFFIDGMGWLLALILGGFGIVRLAKKLRTKRFGDVPPKNPISTQDFLAVCLAVLFGPMLIVWFSPRILELSPENFSELLSELKMRWVDGVIVLVGVCLIVWPVRTFLRYVNKK